MHTITFDKECELGASKIKVEGYVPYLCENFNAGQYLAEQSNNAVTSTFCNTKTFDTSKDWNGKSILFLRAGGYGDLLMTTPIFKQLKKNYPKCEIEVSTNSSRHEVFKNNPHIDGLRPYPYRLDLALQHDAIVCFEDLIELSEEAKVKHPIDLFADHLGITVEDKHLDLNLTHTELQWARDIFPYNGKRIFVQMFASSPVRTYIRMGLVLGWLCKKGYEVFAVGERGVPIKEQIPELKVFHFTDLLNVDGMTFRKVCAVMTTCDCVVAPDSAHVHTAGALDIPCVALYGSFDWHTRTCYYPKCYAIQGHGDCAPCYHHSRKGWELFPSNQSCSKKSPHVCDVLGEIDYWRVIKKVEDMF